MGLPSDPYPNFELTHHILQVPWQQGEASHKELKANISNDNPLIQKPLGVTKKTMAIRNRRSGVVTNVFRIGLIIEPKKLLIHGSLVGPVVESMIP